MGLPRLYAPIPISSIPAPANMTPMQRMIFAGLIFCLAHQLPVHAQSVDKSAGSDAAAKAAQTQLPTPSASARDLFSR